MCSLCSLLLRAFFLRNVYDLWQICFIWQKARGMRFRTIRRLTGFVWWLRLTPPTWWKAGRWAWGNVCAAAAATENSLSPAGMSGSINAVNLPEFMKMQEACAVYTGNHLQPSHSGIWRSVCGFDQGENICARWNIDLWLNGKMDSLCHPASPIQTFTETKQKKKLAQCNLNSVLRRSSWKLHYNWKCTISKLATSYFDVLHNGPFAKQHLGKLGNISRAL